MNSLPPESSNVISINEMTKWLEVRNEATLLRKAQGYVISVKRKSRDLTEEELAKKACLYTAQIHNLEAGNGSADD